MNKQNRYPVPFCTTYFLVKKIYNCLQFNWHTSLDSTEFVIHCKFCGWRLILPLFILRFPHCVSIFVKGYVTSYNWYLNMCWPEEQLRIIWVALGGYGRLSLPIEPTNGLFETQTTVKAMKLIFLGLVSEGYLQYIQLLSLCHKPNFIFVHWQVWQYHRLTRTWHLGAYFAIFFPLGYEQIWLEGIGQKFIPFNAPWRNYSHFVVLIQHEYM